VGRIAIFTDDPGWHGARLKEAFAIRGYQGSYVSLTECRLEIDVPGPGIVIPGFETSLPDGVFVRGVPGGSLDEVVFYLNILHALEARSITVYNDGRAIERSVDKAMTRWLLFSSGIPTPITWVLADRNKARAIVNENLRLGQAMVCKPLFGSQGIGVEKITRLADFDTLEDKNGVYYLQQFISSGTDESFDWRVFVIAGQAIAAMRRCGIGWLNNVAQGARCELEKPHGILKQLAESAVQALQMNYGGVDIICDECGRYSVIEVNSIPAWKGLQSVCDINVADRMAIDFLAQCQRTEPNQMAL